MDIQDSFTSSCGPGSTRAKLIRLLHAQTLPEPLSNIAKIMTTYSIARDHNPKTLIQMVDRLCEQVLRRSTESIMLASLSRDEEIDIVLQKFLSYPHHKEIQNRIQIEPMIKQCRQLMSQYFHYLVHGITLKNIAKLTVIFYKLLCLEMLTLKIVNYFFLILVLAQQNISSNRDIKLIKACLRNLHEKGVIYAALPVSKNYNHRKKSSKESPLNYHLYEQSNLVSLSFTIICYVIFCTSLSSSKSNEGVTSEDRQIIKEIVSCPLQLTSMCLMFRHEFPNSHVYSCSRNLASLAECIIDSYFLKSLLIIYLDFKLEPEWKKNVYSIIENLANFNLNVHTVKNMIKRLEIHDCEDMEAQWNGVFLLLKAALPQQFRNIEVLKNKVERPQSPKKPESEKQTLKFTSLSHMTISLQSELRGFNLHFRSYRIYGEYILMKLKNEQQEIWIIVRHIEESQFQIAVMNVDSSNSSMKKIDLQWNPFDKHQIQCIVQGNLIQFVFSTVTGDQKACKKPNECGSIKVANIKAKQIKLGSTQNDNLAYFSEVNSFNILTGQNNSKSNFIQSNRNRLYEFSHNVTVISKMPLIIILNKLGDLDLFFLITSHLIRKVDQEELLLRMITQIINFLECLVAAKGVYGINLNEQMKQNRFYNVRCLVWLASKYKRDPDAILEIFRLLSIRGNQKPLHLLQILSNIGLWKQVPEKLHVKLIQKIRETCAKVGQQKANQLMGIMRKIVLDYLVFYKNNQLVCENLQNQYLLKHAQILQLVYNVVVNQTTIIVVEFVEFIFKILYLLLDRTKSSDYVDASIGFELSLLAFRLVFSVKQEQVQTKRQRTAFTVTSSKKPLKFAKSGLASSKSMNITFQSISRKDEQSLIVRIEQCLAWANQIMYMLNNQLQTADEIKYYDWSWNLSSSFSSSSMFLPSRKGLNFNQSKITNQSQIIRLCELTLISLSSLNRNIFNVLNPYDLTAHEWSLFWQVNLFDDKIKTQSLIDAIKFGHFNTIAWNDTKVCKIIQKSFSFVENGQYVKLPSKFVESMKIQNVNTVHNLLLGIYLEISLELNSIEKQKCAEKIMYFVALLPDFVFSNTQLLREQISKQKRNLRTIQIIQKHLIIKELVNEGFKLVRQSKIVGPQQLFSTIVAFDDKKTDNLNSSQVSKSEIRSESEETHQADSKQSKPKTRKNSTDMNVFQLENVQFQQSFFENSEAPTSQVISSQRLKDSLEHLRLLANPAEMENFYKISTTLEEKKEAKEQLDAHITNFNLNMDAIISILDESTNQNKTSKLNQLQNYIFFIEKHIYSFSKMILISHLFAENRQIKVQEQRLRVKRKKSYKNSTYLKFKEQAESVLENFLRERRKSVYKMQNIWLSVQKNNKQFWQIFFKSEKKNQSVDLVCNGMKLKGLIKVDHEKREIELPKNMTTLSNKFSISGDSDKDMPFEDHAQSVIFQAEYYQQPEQMEQRQEGKVLSPEAARRKRMHNEFSVFYITTTTVYQGLLTCDYNSITFNEDAAPDDHIYDYFCVNQNERRNVFQIEKKKQEFTISLNDKSTIVPKKYLYCPTAVQIYSQKKTTFLFFRKSVNREKFLKKYQNFKGTIFDSNQLIQTVHKQTERWINGDITNYTYLMHLNDLSGRTFNDMSQYYIFPWIITNYESEKFNKKFINNPNNYRDLAKPVGALNPKRLEELLTRYKDSFKYNQSESYLFGSYCSNPAIVCNYLVRLEPFSMHHFLLQSKQFDIADRIFYSVGNQYNGCYTNIGDYKQLIPEFYSSPEFLRNRNKYKFGEKQNKEVVNNVELPKWAHYEFNRKSKTSENFSPEEQFVFRMKKCLETQYVTKNLNLWIDLIFGVYNKKQRALQRNNLYIPNIYINQLSKKDKTTNFQTQLIFFKEFGQLPKDIFDRDHKFYKANRTYYKLGHSQSVHVAQFSQSCTSSYKRFYADFRYFIRWDSSSIDIIDIKNKTGLIDKSQNTLTQVPLKNESVSEVKVITAEGSSEENKKMDLLIYLKNGKVMVRQMVTTTFRKKLQIKQQKQNFFNVDTRFHLMEVYDEQKLLIFVGPASIKIYNYSLQANSIQKSGDLGLPFNRFQSSSITDETIKILLNKKIQFRLTMKYQFTHHKSAIEHIAVCNSYGLLISLDSNRKAYILKLNSKQKEIENIQYFRLKKLTNCQNVIQMQVHQMGYIIVLTTLNIIHVFNLMGDCVALFNGCTLQQINNKMQKKVESAVDISKQPLISKQSPQGQKNQRKGSDVRMDQKTMSYEIDQSDPENATVINQMEEQPKKPKTNEKLNQNSIGSLQNTLFKQQSVEQIKCFKIWSHESGELIIGTNLGNLYRFDLYMMDDCEKINFLRISQRKSKEIKKEKQRKYSERIDSSIEYISVNRIGRHWQCWAASFDELFKIQSEDYRHADKRNDQYKKKCAFE